MVREQVNLIFWSTVTAIAAWAWYTLPHIDHPLGSDWGHYFTVAEYIWEPKDGLAYPDFRKPYFGWVLGGLGQWLGFFPAAQIIGRISMLVMVFSAALLGWALAGRWAGLAACFIVPLMPLTMDGALWVNHYPLLGAVTGLSVASAAMSTRSNHLCWPMLAGLMGGVAYALDMRGAIALPIAICLVGLGRASLGWIGVAKGFASIAVLSGTVLAHDAWLQTAFQVPQLEFEQQLIVQNPECIVVHSAAVGDYEVQDPSTNQKIASGQNQITLELKPTPKILDRIQEWSNMATIISFKAAAPTTTTEDLASIAHDQLLRTNSNMVFANNIEHIERGVMLVERDKCHVYETRESAIEALIAHIVALIETP